MPKVLIPEPMPPAVEALLEERRRIGADRHDEMWDGVLHMARAARDAHALVIAQLMLLLAPLAQAEGLVLSVEFNLGVPDDYRIPDAGLHRARWGLYATTAALVVEVVSPGDETWDKLPFYAAHDVDELLIVDTDARSAHWFALTDGEYAAVDRSRLVHLGAAELAAAIDWPA